MEQETGYHILALCKKPLATPPYLVSRKGRMIWANNTEEFLELIKVHKPVIAMIEELLWDKTLGKIEELIIPSEDVHYAVLFRAPKEYFTLLLDEKKIPLLDICESPMTQENLNFYVKKSHEILNLSGRLKMKEEKENREISHNISRLEKKVFDFFTLSQLGKSLLSIQDMNQLCHVFISSVYEASDASNCAIFVRDDSKLNFKLRKSMGLIEDDVKDLEFLCEEGLFWQVLNSGEPFYIKDSTGEYRFKHMIEKWNLDKLDSYLWFPLMVKDTLVGILTMGKRKDKIAYTAEEVTFLSQLAAQAAVAIDSAILDQQKAHASKELRRKMDNLSAIYDVSQALNFAQDLQRTLILILDKSKEAAHAQKASLMLLNKDTMELEVKVVRGIDPVQEAKINRGEVETTKIKVGEGIAGKVAATKKYMIVNEVGKDTQFKKSDQSNVNSILCMPLVANDECIGVMNITNKHTGELFTDEDAEFLTTLCGQAAITIYNAQLYHLAITDGLTQLHIHRYFEQRLHDEILRAQRKGHPVSLIMSDIDHFKKFNDTFGHQQGDIVLIYTAKLFRLNVREIDIACRYGGEEYAVILPETSLEDAVMVAERLRKKIETYDFPGPNQGQTLKVTVSLGVSTFPIHAKGETELVKAADAALYYSKEHGRNRVSVASDVMKQAA